MKALHFSRIAYVMTLALSACGGGDSPFSGLSSTDPAEHEDSATDEATTPASDSTTPAAVLPEGEVTPSSGGDAAVDTETPPLDAALIPSDAADLEWRNCGQFENRNLQCSEVLVPVDYEQPDGEQVSIGLRRIQANPLEPYHGALLFNPGGPGGEGIDTTLSLFEGRIFDAIAPGYDIVGFDPRGVGSSGETGCGIFPDEMYPGATPTEAPEFSFADAVAAQKAQGEHCEATWGPLFRKLGSNNVVRDLEEIRKALKEPVLNFYGASYGTQLGALYAHRYPETTGRIVLDASVMPRSSVVENVRGKFQQAIALHESLFSNCDSGVYTCPPEPRLVFDQILANAAPRGLERAFVNVWSGLLRDSSGVNTAVALLNAEAADPGGDWILDFFGSLTGGETGLSDVVNSSVNCTDDAFEPPTQAEFENLTAEFRETSPLFADTFLPLTALCVGWPVTRDPVPMPTATNARPLLVIGGTADGLTPYDWSRQMAEALGSSTLLTSNHYGHTALINGGDCVYYMLRAYLTSGSLPAAGTVCN